MKLITRYILRQFFPIFFLTLMAFVSLYLVIDFFEKLNVLVSKQFPFGSIYLYFLCKTPFIVTQGIPVAVLLATLLTLGILKRNHELVALKAAGIGSSAYTKPIIIVALFTSLVHFGFAEFAARPLSRKAEQVWDRHTERNAAAVIWSHENIWYHGQNAIYQIRLYDQRNQSLERVSLFYLDPQFTLIQRVDARQVLWRDQRWIARDVLFLQFKGPEAKQEWFDEKVLKLPESPEDFAGLKALPDELDWLDLYHYARKIRFEGYNADPLDVEVHFRIAFPLTSLILALLGIALVLHRGFHTGMASSVILATLGAFIFLFFLQIGCALATAGLLPASLGVWGPSVIFAALPCYFLMNQE